MNQIIKRLAGMRAGATTALIATICGAFAILPASQASATLQQHALQFAADPDSEPAPEPSDDSAEDKDVPTSQVDKYISVYEAMQKDRNLTVDQAAPQQGLTVAQFRALENKIEADDTLRERVRKALRHAANPNQKDDSSDD